MFMETKNEIKGVKKNAHKTRCERDVELNSCEMFRTKIKGKYVWQYLVCLPTSVYTLYAPKKGRTVFNKAKNRKQLWP